MKKDNDNLARAMALGAQLAVFIAASIILGQGLDYLMKDTVKTRGIFTFVCLILGFVGFVAKLLRDQKK